MAGYGMTVRTPLSMDQAEAEIRAALADEGFGILTEIDLAATLAEKVQVEHPPYKILGACNPMLANQALGAEEQVGLLLPCNVIVYESDGGTVVAAIDPATIVQLAANPQLEPIAREAHSRLVRALERLSR